MQPVCGCLIATKQLVSENYLLIYQFNCFTCSLKLCSSVSAKLRLFLLLCVIILIYTLVPVDISHFVTILSALATRCLFGTVSVVRAVAVLFT